ncbi:hypothetical protein ACS0TY_023587 [Phlomoides rotata]
MVWFWKQGSGSAFAGCCSQIFGLTFSSVCEWKILLNLVLFFSKFGWGLRALCLESASLAITISVAFLICCCCWIALGPVAGFLELLQSITVVGNFWDCNFGVWVIFWPICFGLLFALFLSFLFLSFLFWPISKRKDIISRYIPN